MKNFSHTIEEGIYAGKTLWSGRYCAICAIVLYFDPIAGWMILLNKRGSGTPDFQHMWNIPCGYIEADETAQEACSRELLEECHTEIEPKKFNLIKVETNPKICNNGNITLRFLAFANNTNFVKTNIIGEQDEVENIGWFELKVARNLDLAFNHNDIIKYLMDNIDEIPMMFDAGAEKELIEID